MHFEFLLEEPSAEAALQILLPRILGETDTFRIHAYRSKGDLLGSLHGRLRGYAKWIPQDWRIVVLVDEDRQDCHELKRRLNEAATAAGLIVRSNPSPTGSFQVINRIAIEELEAWFFGDVAALCAAYPGVPPTLGKRARFRDSDAIRGGTWEALERVLQRAGYHTGGLAKISAARDIAQHMDPMRNRSKSFAVFRDSLVQGQAQRVV